MGIHAQERSPIELAGLEDLDRCGERPGKETKIGDEHWPGNAYLIGRFSRLLAIVAGSKEKEQKGNSKPDGQHQIHVSHARVATGSRRSRH